MNTSRTGRRYDREFKNNAVALVRSGRTVLKLDDVAAVLRCDARLIGFVRRAPPVEERDLLDG